MLFPFMSALIDGARDFNFPVSPITSLKSSWESVNDKFIYDLVKDLVKESASKIAVKYKFDEKSNLGYIEKTIDRFKNPYLKGKEIRTGKNQLKRLNEYAKMTNNFNIFTSNLEIFNMLNDDMRRSY